MSGGRGGSLQARLLLSLGLAIAVAALAEVGLSYRTALREADAILDGYMQRTAWSLRASTILEDAGVPPGAFPGLGDGGDANYEVYVQVWSADGLRAFRSDARITLPRQVTLGFANVRANGTTYRIYSLPAGPHLIQVAQDLASRRVAAGQLALRTVSPILFLAPLLMIVTVWVVRRSLAPVARVRRQVAAREPDDLTAIGPEDLPEEIRPLVEELNLLLQRVGRAFAAQQHFVADAAHELRSPLAAIKLQLQGLQRAADETTRTVAIERLGAGIDRATRLVEQLLVLARQEARLTARERPAAVSLADIARGVIAEIAPAAQARRIDLGLGAADPGMIDGHADALRILLRNLLDNAVKYTPEGGAIDVEVCEAESTVVLRVEDTGPGIPPAERAAALERFRRGADQSQPGSGLGLAIVQAIVELHGASFMLGESERRGGLRAEVRFRSPAPSSQVTA